MLHPSRLRFQNKRVVQLFCYFGLVGAVGIVLVIARILARVLVLTMIFVSILFLSAGRMDWLEAWILAALYSFFLFVFMLWGTVFARGLMKERERVAKNVKPWDKIINLFFTHSFIAVLVVAGMDERYAWSHVHAMIQIAGIAAIVAAGVIIIWTMNANAFLSRWARIQDDRGHQVVSQGPYRFVRHPMYAAIILFILGTSLELGSVWSFIPAGIAIVIYVIRTNKEDHMLQEELDGYHEYAATVRYRLIPRLW